MSKPDAETDHDPHCGCTLAERAVCFLDRLAEARADAAKYRLPAIVMQPELLALVNKISKGEDVDKADTLLRDAEAILDAHIVSRTAMLHSARRPPSSNAVH